MRILITGANGFLGSHLCAKELSDGNEVVAIVRDLNHKSNMEVLEQCVTLFGDISDFQFVKRVIADYEIDVVYHVAAQSIVRIANRNPINCYESNVFGTINVLEAIRQVGRKTKVICMSSDKAYGTHDTLPYTEDMKLQPDDVYSTSKACADLIAQSYYKTYGINVNIVRCANIYGFDPNRSRIIPNTITRIINGEKPQIYSGVMKYKREFIYVGDVVEAFQVIRDNGKPGEAYNIGDEESEFVIDIVNRICRLMNYTGDIDVMEKDFNEIPQQWLSAKKLNEIGWAKTVSLTQGLKWTITAYEDESRSADSDL